MLQRAFVAAVITAACVAMKLLHRPPPRSVPAGSRSTASPTRSASPAPVRRSAGRSAATAADVSSPLPGRRHQGRRHGLGQRRGPLPRFGERALPGPALESATQYRWKVRVWDESGKPSEYSAPAQLETALLTNADWTAKWIAAPADDLNLSGARWIWHEDGTQNMPALTRYLRTSFTLASAPSSARLLFTVDDEAAIYVNGTLVADTKALRDNDENAWQKAQIVEVAL